VCGALLAAFFSSQQSVSAGQIAWRPFLSPWCMAAAFQYTPFFEISSS